MRRLLALGKLRRAAAPEPELVAELFRAAARELTCPDCQAVGLAVNAADDEADWPGAHICQGCGKPIQPERIEALPGAVLCAACQQLDESGGPAEPDFCPKCGSLMVLRASTGPGLARYRLVCTGSPPCRL